MMGQPCLQRRAGRLLARMQLLVTGLGVLAGQAVTAIQVAVLLPGQTGAASFAITVDGTLPTFGQIGYRVLGAQLS